MNTEENLYKKITVRIYALIINDKQQILLSDEFALNREMTKFPGGGLEYGESTRECLQRESREEMNQEIEVFEHFYTTDFFQPAITRPDFQLLSIYYFAGLLSPEKLKTSAKPHDYAERINGSISFRWQNISDLKPEELSFPIDRKVVTLLKQKFNVEP